VTVCHTPGKRVWARDDDGDGIREVHVNTIEGLWTGLRNFLRPFRGVSKIVTSRVDSGELARPIQGATSSGEMLQTAHGQRIRHAGLPVKELHSLRSRLLLDRQSRAPKRFTMSSMQHNQHVGLIAHIHGIVIKGCIFSRLAVSSCYKPTLPRDDIRCHLFRSRTPGIYPTLTGGKWFNLPVYTLGHMRLFSLI